MIGWTLAEAAEELERQAYALSHCQPMPLEILKDLVATSGRLKKHADQMLGWRAELAGILHRLEQLDSPPSAPSGDLMDQWRSVALEFHCIQDCLVRKQLFQGFEPGHLVRLRKSRALTPSVRGVLTFLLHIYDSANRFDLAETQRWDAQHQNAFLRWVNGHSSGQPCRYF